VVAAAMLSWGAASIYYDVLLSPMPVFVQAALTVFIYPAMALILMSLSRWMPSAQ
jgi:hypothetical protein